jgi:threonylcarbamoyladenosine tRNA methylthiotransferase MtaB
MIHALPFARPPRRTPSRISDWCRLRREGQGGVNPSRAGAAAKTVAFHTFGCKVNQYETEELRHQLGLGGFEVVPLGSAADVYVVNSCSVTADADRSCRQLVRRLAREHPSSRIVVTGCYAERAPEELRAMWPQVEVFGNKEKPIIARALGVPTACIQAAADSGVIALGDRTRAYVKVQDGCDAHCTYCIIPTVRPELVCRAPELVVREVQSLLARGYREIVLTGVRLGRYEWQMAGERWDLLRLVRRLLSLAGDFRIRLSSLEVTEISNELISLLASEPKLCPHLHIPLQSGDGAILKRMGRWYTAAAYRTQVRKIKERIPDVALSTDVIVGFPGESQKQFQNTVDLVTEEGLSRLHVFRYSARPGTPAERFPDQVDPRLKSERAHALVRVDQALRARYARRFLGRRVRVLQESDGSGLTERYVRVRSTLPLAEGTFHAVTPTQLGRDAILVV